MKNQTNKFEDVRAMFRQKLSVNQNMDAKEGEFILGGSKCAYYYLEGFLNKQALERVTNNFKNSKDQRIEQFDSALDFCRSALLFSECVRVNFEDALNRVLSGFLVIVFEAFSDEYLAIEARTTPQRAIQEPSKGKTLRGPHEGFCENIVTNLALLRRRIKSLDLMVEECVVGAHTQTRIALCYLSHKADEKLVSEISQTLKNAVIPSLSMGEESVAELLFYRKKRARFNPLPRVRFCERPDACAAQLLEGKVVLLIDTTPSAVILPMTLFEYFEECDNYYFPPITATYLRMIRFFSIFFSIFIVPLWMLLLDQSAYLPQSLSFLLIKETYAVPIFLQLIIIEIAIDSLKLASLNTPEPLANSLSVVGGLLLGEFAVKSGWFVEQTILYSAIVTILNFIPNNYELGYSLKFGRMILLIAVELFGFPGFVSANLLFALLLFRMKDVAGNGYLYPLIPFSAKGIYKIFVKTIHGREAEQ